MSFTTRSLAATLLLIPSNALAQAGAQPAPPPPADTSTAVAMSSAFRAAAERTLPAVVFIAIEQAPLAMRSDQSPQFRDVFPAPMQPPPRLGTGSGVIIDAQGHILTNNHVVADASRLTVRLVDGREYTARLVGSDVSTDIAVIRIEPRSGESLPVAELGDSDALEVGDWVLALGNPLGLTFTVTAGIVSAKGRQISAGAAPTLESFIQTDAVINPGNSGGPLIDLLGRVVGINSAIFGSDRFVGYGFAVPIDIARRVMSDLLEYGYLRRPRLGVAIDNVTAVEAELYRLPEVRGAIVVNIEPGQPADRAGLRLADVIMTLNGSPITDDADLIARLARLQPNEEITLRIIREGRQQDVRVRLGEFDRGAAPPPQREQPRPDMPEQILGFMLADLTPDVAQRAGYRGEGGAIVRNLVQFSSAYRANLREGMIVLSINGHRIRNAEEARRIARDIDPGSAVALIVYDPERGETLVTYRAMQ